MQLMVVVVLLLRLQASIAPPVAPSIILPLLCASMYADPPPWCSPGSGPGDGPMPPLTAG